MNLLILELKWFTHKFTEKLKLKRDMEWLKIWGRSCMGALRTKLRDVYLIRECKLRAAKIIEKKIQCIKRKCEQKNSNVQRFELFGYN